MIIFDYEENNETTQDCHATDTEKNEDEENGNTNGTQEPAIPQNEAVAGHDGMTKGPGHEELQLTPTKVDPRYINLSEFTLISWLTNISTFRQYLNTQH